MTAGKTVDQAASEYAVPRSFKNYTATAAPNLTVASSLQIALDELRKK